MLLSEIGIGVFESLLEAIEEQDKEKLLSVFADFSEAKSPEGEAEESFFFEETEYLRQVLNLVARRARDNW